MKPVRIENHTNELSAPADWSAEENGRCGVLYVRQERMSGIPFMRSAWEAEADEALCLAAGASLVLGIAGVIDPPRYSHPVVNITIDGLPDEFQPPVLARRIPMLNGAPAAQVDMIFPNHGSPRRGTIQVYLEGRGFAHAVAFGIEQIEALARVEGWIE